MTRPQNPYIAGNPISDQDRFIGRADVMRETLRVLRNPNANAVVLHGQRRIGKTSILLRLEKDLPSDEYCPVYFDLQDKAAMPLGDVLYQLAQTIATATNMELPPRTCFDADGSFFRTQFLPAAAEHTDPRTLVLLFDEFDVLDLPQEGQAGSAFFPYLRAWMAQTEGVKFVFVLGRRPEELSTDTLATFKGTQSQRISLISHGETVDVAHLSEKNQSLYWSDAALAQLWQWTQGHPYFTQLLCSELWEATYDDEPDSAPTVTVDDVDDAVPDALEQGANAFQWIWNGLPAAERIVMAAMAEETAETISYDRLTEILNRSGVRLILRELELAPETLEKWDLLRRVPMLTTSDYGSPLEQTVLRYIDSQMMGASFTQNEFWDHILEPIPLRIQDENVRDLYAIAKENHFGAFTLEALFRGLGDAGWKVGLLLDEFEAILSHPVLNSTEFYGSLRSIASRFGSLAIVIATRRSLDDLNVDTQKLNPHGSPYFNTFTEQRIGALPQSAADAVLKQAGTKFSKADRDFVLDLSGRHPYLLQLAAALLWDYEPRLDDEADDVRYETVANELYDQTDAHFNDTWRSWSNAERKVITAIALAQIPALVEGHDFKWQALIEDIDDFSPELRGLQKDGTVIETEYDGVTGYAISQRVLLWWLADTIKREVRDETAWNQWLEAQEFGAVLTKQERERFDSAAKTVRDTVGRGATTLIEAFVKGFGDSLGKSLVT